MYLPPTAELRAAVIANRNCASHRMSSAVRYHAQQGADQLRKATHDKQPAAVELLDGVQQAIGNSHTWYKPAFMPAIS